MAFPSTFEKPTTSSKWVTMQKPRRAHPQGFGARPPRALQRPNCKRISISQRHRVLGSCCGRAPALRDAAAFTRPREHPQGFGARPPRALQHPNCKRISISQRHRVLGSCCGRGARAPGRWRVYPAPRASARFGARPPQALQRPNCERISISQRHRVLGSCCGRGASAPGRWRVYPAPRASAGVRSAPASGAATSAVQASRYGPN